MELSSRFLLRKQHLHLAAEAAAAAAAPCEQPLAKRSERRRLLQVPVRGCNELVCVSLASAAQQALQLTGCWRDTPPPRPAPWEHHPGRKQDTSAGTQESMGFRSRWGLGVNVPETQPAVPALCRPPPPRPQPHPWRARARRRHLRRCCSVSAAAKRSCGGLLTRMPKQQAEGLHSNVATVRYCNHPWLTPLKVPKHDTLIWNSSSFPIFPPRALREALWRGRAGAQPG
jgi:hypothetical protein